MPTVIKGVVTIRVMFGISSKKCAGISGGHVGRRDHERYSEAAQNLSQCESRVYRWSVPEYGARSDLLRRSWCKLLLKEGVAELVAAAGLPEDASAMGGFEEMHHPEGQPASDPKCGAGEDEHPPVAAHASADAGQEPGDETGYPTQLFSAPEE